MQIFSNRLIELRKEAGLTQRNLADILHSKRSTISGYETEGKEPNIETLCLLAKYFGVSTDYLLGYSDERNHIENVFYNDNVNFKRNFDSLTADLKPMVAKCFDSFYLLLNLDMKMHCTERLALYLNLMQLIQSSRTEIRKHVESSGSSLQDPAFLSDLMSLQSNLKNEVAALLDQLMQADMSVTFDVKKVERGEFLGKVAT